MLEIIGQGLGILAVVTGFISYQMKKPAGLLIFQLATALIFSAHYFCIGNALTAAALNFLAAVKCLFFYLRDKRGGKGNIELIVFSVIVIITSIMTWEAWYSALIMGGLVVATVSLAMPDTQKTRYCMFVKSPLCLAYNILVGSVGGAVYECTVLVSSIIGIIRNRKKTKE